MDSDNLFFREAVRRRLATPQVLKKCLDRRPTGKTLAQCAVEMKVIDRAQALAVLIFLRKKQDAPRPAQKKRRPPLFWIGTGAVALVLGIVMILLLARRSPQADRDGTLVTVSTAPPGQSLAERFAVPQPPPIPQLRYNPPPAPTPLEVKHPHDEPPPPQEEHPMEAPISSVEERTPKPQVEEHPREEPPQAAPATTATPERVKPPPKTKAQVEAERVLTEAETKFERKLYADALERYRCLLTDHASAIKPQLPFIQQRSKECVELIRTDEWVRAETEHYYIEVQKFAVPQTTSDKMLAELKQLLELVFHEYSTTFDFKGKIERRAHVRIYKEQSAYLADGHPAEALAYYNRPAKQIVAYFPADRAKLSGCGMHITPGDKKSMLFNVLCHECCHQFFDLAFPGFYANEKALAWLSEGLAECFGASQVRNGRLVILLTQTEIARSRLETIKEAIRNRSYKKLKQFVAMDYTEFMHDGQVNYAQAWTLCHFLLSYGSVPGYGIYKPLVAKLVQELKEGKSPDQALREAFTVKGKPIDWDRIEAQYLAYVQRLY